MTGENKKERVRAVVDRLCGGPVMNALAPPRSQLDISRPNIHDSKAEYLHERATVDKALTGIGDALEALIGNLSEDDNSQSKMFNRLTSVIDLGARHRTSGQQPKTASELIRLNAAQNSLSINGLKLLLDFRIELRERLVELQDQEAQFWSVKHRPANYYARAIALRLARLYASEFHKRPTYGTSRDGGHPSTDFCRALEEIFEILEIKASVKSTAKWAIDGLTEEDLHQRPPLTIGELRTAIGGGDPDNAILSLLGAMKKDPTK